MSEIEVLAAFWAARLDEDEAAAKACPLATWEANGPTPGSGYVGPPEWYLVGRVDAHNGKLLAQGTALHDPHHHCLIHAARHDPARVLRRIARDRRIMALHTGRHECPGDEGYAWYGDDEAPWCQTVRLHVAEWDRHPDYREAWKP